MLPCTKIIGFIEEGFKELARELSRAQLRTMLMAATALVLGSDFNLSQMARAWLLEKSINAFWYLFNQAKIRFITIEELRFKMIQSRYGRRLRAGRFIIDDTLNHHTKLCRFIHAVFTFWDHVWGTNLKAQCLVFLYYQEEESPCVKFPLGWKIYYKEGAEGAGVEKERQLESGKVYKEKYQLALELIKSALEKGFNCSIVIADSWFCIEDFMKELRKLQLMYLFELKSNRTVRVAIAPEQRVKKCKGRKRTKWYNLVALEEFFNGSRIEEKAYGFERDLETGKEEKVLYQVKEAVVQMNAYKGKHKVLRSYNPEKGSVKFFITNELTWEAKKIIQEWLARWVVEEFFRNAKQLLDMEGACVRSEQGVTLALFLVTYVDSLLHLEIVKKCAFKNSQSEPVTVQSIVRLTHLENIENFIKIVEDEDRWVVFRDRWLKVLRKFAVRERKAHKELVELNQTTAPSQDLIAA